MGNFLITKEELSENYYLILDYARDYNMHPLDVMHDVLKEWRLATNASLAEQDEMYDTLMHHLKKNGEI